MPLVTGTGLQNQSDVIDAVRSALASQGWTTAHDSGTVGSNDKEVWMHLPASLTFNGIDILVGMKSKGPTSPPEEAGGRMALSMSYMTPAQALVTGVSPKNGFYNVLGTPNRNFSTATTLTTRPTGNNGGTYPAAFGGTVLSSSVAAVPSVSNLWNQGGNYGNHWIITPNNSPLGATEQYCYVVVEVTTGVYRSLAFGEGIKLGGGSWTGGLFLHSSHSAPNGNSPLQQTFTLGGDSEYNAFQNDGEHGYVLNFNNANNEFYSPRQWNPWMGMNSPQATDEVSVMGMGPRALGRDFIDRSPVAFSGQSMRLPARFYAMDNPVSASAGWGSPSNRRNNIRPLIECPDFFHTNIRDFVDGGVIQDDAEKFLVVPYHRRTGTDNSGNYGFLIRHPDLTP